MGPNGSGKSTLAQVLAGREGYEVTQGTVTLRGHGPARAARPKSVRAKVCSSRSSIRSRFPGVNNVYLLKAGLNAIRKHRGEPEVDAFEFLALVREKMKLMQMDESFLNRGVNEGFSGGEKKRNEILQMAVLEPTLALLDETDSGLDIDALRVVANGVNSLRRADRAIVHGHALSAAARLHRARPRARAVGRTHREERRQVARARAREARLRLGQAGGGGRMSATRSKNRVAARSSAIEPLFDARCAPRRCVDELRRAALERFLARGFPTQRDEEWKYTNLRRLESRTFAPADGRGQSPPTIRDWIADAGTRIVLVDGHCDAGACRRPARSRRASRC